MTTRDEQDTRYWPTDTAYATLGFDPETAADPFRLATELRSLADRIETAAAPDVIVMVVECDEDDEIEDADGALLRNGAMIAACPHDGCDSTAFYEVDAAIRWNRIDEVTEPDGWFGVYPGDSDFHTTGHLCQGCQQPVTWVQTDETEVTWG